MTGLLGSPRATMRATCERLGWRLLDQLGGCVVLDYGTTRTPVLTWTELGAIFPALVRAELWLRGVGR